MRIAIITGGPNIDDVAADIALSCDKVLCADSGADYAFNHHIMPECVYGDLDSISDEGKMRIDTLGIPVELFPVEKDMTDTELVLSKISVEDEIILICSLAGRIDHVMANLQILMKMHTNGYKITATDGVTDVIPMCDDEQIRVGELFDTESIVVSLVPASVDEVISDVTTEGLYYGLNNTQISGGSSYTISNKLIDGADEFTVAIGKGKLYVVVTNSSL